MPYYFLSEETARLLRIPLYREICALKDELMAKEDAYDSLMHPFKAEDILFPDKTIEPTRETQEIRDFMAEKKDLDTIEQATLLDGKPIMDGKPDYALCGCGERLHLGACISTYPIQPQTPAEKLADKAITNAFPLAPKREDMLIEKFPHDRKQNKTYNKTLTYYESPAGEAALLYNNKYCYVSKEKILQLPWEMPNGYLKTSGLTKDQITAIRAYREMLFVAENNKKFATKLSAAIDEADPDRVFRSFGLNKNTRVGKESENKIEGDLPQ